VVTLALVGVPITAYSYPAFKALAAAGGALGATFSAAQAAAIAAIAAGSAAALGAGVGGYLLGEAILRGLEQPPVLPDMGEYFEAGNQNQLVRLLYDYYVDGEQLFSNQPSQFVVAPVKGIFFRVIDGASTWFVFDGNGVQQNIVSTGNKASGTRFELKGFVNGANEAVTPTKRLPSYVPKNPSRPAPSSPVPVTIPGLPPFPITPVVVPNPGNDEPSENEERPPGVIVQIPQTGQQFNFTPSGVRESRYNAPNREPFRVPVLTLPPGGKAATPPCCEVDTPECPEVNLDEIVCRLKALQDELLDDGFNNINGETPNANSGFYEALDGDFYKVRIDITQRPANLRIQPSTAPAMDVWFVGWFSWIENGFPGERIPLHFENNCFLAPLNVTGFMYQTNFGCKAIGRWTRRTKRDYVDQC